VVVRPHGQTLVGLDAGSQVVLLPELQLVEHGRDDEDVVGRDSARVQWVEQGLVRPGLQKVLDEAPDRDGFFG